MSEEETAGVEFRLKPPLTEAELEPLFAEAWGEGAAQGYDRVLARSLTYVAAYKEGALIGFVNLAWDGNAHAFILDTVVSERARQRGVGIELVRRAIEVAREAGVEWIHVDYEPHLDSFYAKVGMLPTRARIMHLGRGRYRG